MGADAQPLHALETYIAPLRVRFNETVLRDARDGFKQSLPGLVDSLREFSYSGGVTTERYFNGQKIDALQYPTIDTDVEKTWRIISDKLSEVGKNIVHDLLTKIANNYHNPDSQKYYQDTDEGKEILDYIDTVASDLTDQLVASLQKTEKLKRGDQHNTPNLSALETAQLRQIVEAFISGNKKVLARCIEAMSSVVIQQTRSLTVRAVMTDDEVENLLMTINTTKKLPPTPQDFEVTGNEQVGDAYFARGKGNRLSRWRNQQKAKNAQHVFTQKQAALESVSALVREALTSDIDIEETFLTRELDHIRTKNATLFAKDSFLKKKSMRMRNARALSARIDDELASIQGWSNEMLSRPEVVIAIELSQLADNAMRLVPETALKNAHVRTGKEPDVAITIDTYIDIIYNAQLTIRAQIRELVACRTASKQTQALRVLLSSIDTYLDKLNTAKGVFTPKPPTTSPYKPTQIPPSLATIQQNYLGYVENLSKLQKQTQARLQETEARVDESIRQLLSHLSNARRGEIPSPEDYKEYYEEIRRARRLRLTEDGELVDLIDDGTDDEKPKRNVL